MLSDDELAALRRVWAGNQTADALLAHVDAQAAELARVRQDFNTWRGAYEAELVRSAEARAERGAAQAEMGRLREALNEAAQSLRTIADWKRDREREESYSDAFFDLKGYANSRAGVAERALSPAPDATPRACPPHCSLPDTGDVKLCPCSPGDCDRCDSLRGGDATGATPRSESGAETVARLGIDVPTWAADIRKRVAAAMDATATEATPRATEATPPIQCDQGDGCRGHVSPGEPPCPATPETPAPLPTREYGLDDKWGHSPTQKHALCGHVSYRNHDDLCIDPTCPRSAYVEVAPARAETPAPLAESRACSIRPETACLFPEHCTPQAGCQNVSETPAPRVCACKRCDPCPRTVGVLDGEFCGPCANEHPEAAMGSETPAPVEGTVGELVRLRAFARDVRESFVCSRECDEADEKLEGTPPEECPCGGDECWRCAAAQALRLPPWAAGKAGERFYIWDSRSCVGNEALWWRPKAQGYTTDLDDAGLYKRGRERPTDIFVPAALAHRLARPSVHVDTLRDAIAAQPPGDPSSAGEASYGTRECDGSGKLGKEPWKIRPCGGCPACAPSSGAATSTGKPADKTAPPTSDPKERP